MRYDDDEEDDEEDWSDSDSDESQTIACPACGRQVYEDAAYCPHCDHDFTDESANPRRKPLWIILGALACMYAFYRWITLQ
jgi:uncharacterized paraquat-inducible protein A